MNSKNLLFLAATLTAFVLATLFAVVNKVTTTPIEAAAAPAVQDTATSAPTMPPTDMPSATSQPELGPLEAAQIAADSISRTDVYSVESFLYKEQDTFKVVFSSGDIVYVGMNREIVDTAKLQSVVVSVPEVTKPTKKNKNNDGGSNYQPSAPQPPHQSTPEPHETDEPHDDD